MKKNFIICAVLLAAMILAPLAVMERTKTEKTSAEPSNPVKRNTVSVMLTESKSIREMNEREYLIGALAAEMSMSNHDEALKAQTVACYTYLKYVELNGDIAKYGGADISDDSSVCQGYLDKDERKKRWGDNFDAYEEKAGRIVDSVNGQMIVYSDEPIFAAYHELNSGTTESAETVWGEDFPYLQEVESPGDRLSSDYSKTVVYKKDEFKKLCKQLGAEKIPDDAEDWIDKIESSENGYVRSLEICGKEVKGDEFREALGLKSCNLSINCDGEKFTVRTYGSGHTVGMSQYGADYMARQGSDYREILAHYYKNTEIV